MSATEWKPVAEPFTLAAATALGLEARLRGFGFIQLARCQQPDGQPLFSMRTTGWVVDVKERTVDYMGPNNAHRVRFLREFFPFFTCLALSFRFGTNYGDLR